MTLAPLADPFCFLDEHLVVFFVFIEAMFGFTPAALSSCCHLEAGGGNPFRTSGTGPLVLD